MKNTIIVIFILVIILLIGIFVFEKPETIEIEDNMVESVDKTFNDLIVGEWQSTMDSKSIVIFSSEGQVNDIYDGEELSIGTWEIYADENAEYNPSGYFIKANISEEEYVYAIITLNEERLVYNYLDRGNTLEYKRVK